MSHPSPSPIFTSLSSSSPSPSHQRGGSSSKDNIQVVCRVRPMNSREFAENSNRCVSVVHESCKVGEKVFTFNQVFGENAKQDELFDSIGIPVIDGVFQGFNGTIFAYGQTGSGKTYTMMGPDIESDTESELRGIIPRAIEVIFDRIGTLDDMECSVHVSFFEIYNERVNDLLNPKIKNIDMRNMNAEWEEVLTHKTVNGLPKTVQLLVQGLANRKTGSTDMNAISSRSHSIFVVSIKQTNTLTKTSLVSKLYLVDLAGSEKQKKTKSTGERFKEGTNINKSLFVLSRVINALTQNHFVPYRDSVLTKVLKHSLGGNCKTALVINVSPSTFNEGETLSTLQFGANAKKIKNDPHINLLDDNSEAAILKSIVETQKIEITELKKHIDRLTGRDLMNCSMNESMMSYNDMSLNMSIQDIGDGPSGPYCCSQCYKSVEEEEKELRLKYGELKASVRHLMKKVQKMNETQMAYNKRLGDLQKLEKELKAIKDQSEQHQSLVKKHTDLTDSIAKYELDVTRLTKTTKRYNAMFEELKEKAEREEHDYQSLKEKYDGYVAEQEAMLHQVENLKKEREALGAECIELVTIVSDMRKKKDQFNTELLELTANISRSEIVLKEKQELELKSKNMIVKVSRENDRLAEQLIAASADLTQTNNKYIEIKDKIQEKESEIAQLKSQHESLVLEHSECEERNKLELQEIAELQKSIEASESKKNFLQSTVNMESNALNNLNSQLEAIRTSIEREQCSLKESKLKEQGILEELEKLTMDIRMLKEEKANLSSEKDIIASSIPDVERELTLVSEEKEKVQEQLLEQRKSYDDLLDQCSRLRDVLVMTENQCASYKQQIATIDYDVSQKQEEVDRRKRTLEKLSEQKKYFECQYGIIKIQTDSLNQKISDLQFLKLQLEQSSREISEDIAQLTETFNEQKHNQQCLSHQVSEMKEIVKQLNGEHEMYANEIEVEKKMIGELGETLNSKVSEVHEYQSRMEEALRDIQREMKVKMDHIMSQSQDFERKIFSITKRKEEVSLSPIDDVKQE